MASTLITDIPSGFKQNNTHPLDGRILYNTIAEALEDNFYRVTPRPSPPYPTPEVIKTNRFIGQKVMIQNPPNSNSPSEYWFKDGITDSDLVKYDQSLRIIRLEDEYELKKDIGERKGFEPSNFSTHDISSGDIVYDKNGTIGLVIKKLNSHCICQFCNILVFWKCFFCF